FGIISCCYPHRSAGARGRGARAHGRGGATAGERGRGQWAWMRRRPGKGRMGGARMSALVIVAIVDRRPHLGVVNGPLSPAARADQARRGAIAVMMDRCAHYVAVIN